MLLLVRPRAWNKLQPWTYIDSWSCLVPPTAIQNNGPLLWRMFKLPQLYFCDLWLPYVFIPENTDKLDLRSTGAEQDKNVKYCIALTFLEKCGKYTDSWSNDVWVSKDDVIMMQSEDRYIQKGLSALHSSTKTNGKWRAIIHSCNFRERSHFLWVLFWELPKGNGH